MNIRYLTRVMKLLMLFLSVGLLHVSASTFSQSVTLRVKQAKLEDVIRSIRQQTGYAVYVDLAHLAGAKPVSIDVKNMPLPDFLNLVLQDQPLHAKIEDKTVVLTRVALPATSNKTIANSSTEAQQGTIRVQGRVIDSLQRPIPGASVRVIGRDIAALTNSSGYFEIQQAPENATLSISYLGYEPIQLRVKTNLGDIQLRGVSSAIQEVLVNTGYQKIDKTRLTGAATVMNEATYDQRVSVSGNFLENLEGKIPGLVYNSQSGELSIRGVSTFDAVKQPLIVVDGFPMEMDLFTINPNDIVSISVLRDAAAASIYGVRASNGVIVVETRRGKQDSKTRINVRATYGFRSRPDFSYLNFAPASEVVDVQRRQFELLKPSETTYELLGYVKNPVYEIMFDKAAGRITEQDANNKLSQLASYDNAKDYQKLFYQQQHSSNLNLDVSGGSAKSTYLAGVNYMGESLNNVGDKNKQVNVNLANTYNFSSRLTADLRAVYTYKTNEKGGRVDYHNFYAYERLVDEHGNALPVKLGPKRDNSLYAITPERNEKLLALGLYDQYYYPYAETYANTQKGNSSIARLQGRLNGKISDWLSAEIGGVFESNSGVNDQLTTEDAYQLRAMINSRARKNKLTGAPEFLDIPRGDQLTRNHLRENSYTLRGQLNFSHRFGGDQHELSGIAGIEQRRILRTTSRNSFFGYDGQVLVSKPVNYQALGGLSFPAFTEVGKMLFPFSMNDYINETHHDTRFMSYYASGTYIYSGKYIATGSLRLDQSNLFGVDKKYKNKPLWSAGLSWLAHKESFLADKEWLSELKIRSSMGFNGNVPASDSGPFLILQSRLNMVPYEPVIANNILAPENQSIRWETTRNYNAGIDFGLWNNRITGSVDGYIKNSFDLFGLYDADPTSGFNQYNANTASIQNRGLEFIVSSANIRKPKFEWHTDLTASFNHNNVTAVKTTEYNNSQLIVSKGINRKDYPMDAVFSYNYGGLNERGQPFVYNKENIPRVLNFYGNNAVDVLFDDLVYSGTTTPKRVLGLNNRVRVGDWELSALFMYYGGHVMRVEQPNPNNLGNLAPNNLLAGSGDFWMEPGDESHTRIPGFPRGNASNPLYFSSYALYGYQYAAEYVKRADYIRLRDVVVTYNARGAFLNKMGLSQTQIRLQAQNPWRYTFSDNSIDPEAINKQNGQRRLLSQPPMYSISLFAKF